MKKSSLVFSILLTLLATVLWFAGSWWYYSCKIKQTCHTQQTIAGESSPTSLPSTLDTLVTDNNTQKVSLVDTDGDGLSDNEENILETDPLLKDTDSDGIPDNEEVGHDINSPLDTDGDGILDALDLDDDNDGISTLIESKIGTSPLHSDTDEDGIADIDEVGKDTNKPLDTDSDGIINALDTDDDDDGIETASEIVFGTNTLLADTDGDGLSDAHEIGDLMDTPLDTNKNGTIDALDTEDDLDQDDDGLSDKLEALLNTDPNNKDSDGDGIGDLAEVGEDTDAPFDNDLDGIIDALDIIDDRDSDNDGLTDAQEEKLASSPNNEDSDGDGINDAEEIGSNFDDPLDSDSDGILNLIDEDDDNDTLLTKYELEIGTNPLSDDSDNDGLSDEKELENSQNNIIQDTDNDGLIDPMDVDDDNDLILTADEIKQGSNPLVFNIPKVENIEAESSTLDADKNSVAENKNQKEAENVLNTSDTDLGEILEEGTVNNNTNQIITPKTQEEMIDSETIVVDKEIPTSDSIDTMPNNIVDNSSTKVKLDKVISTEDVTTQASNPKTNDLEDGSKVEPIQEVDSVSLKADNIVDNTANNNEPEVAILENDENNNEEKSNLIEPEDLLDTITQDLNKLLNEDLTNSSFNQIITPTTQANVINSETASAVKNSENTATVNVDNKPSISKGNTPAKAKLNENVSTESNDTGTSNQKEQLTIESIEGSNSEPFMASRLYFLENSDKLRKSTQITDYFSSVVDWMKLNPNNMISLIGHTNNSGSNKENLALGIRRAMEVREALIELGAPFQQIDFLSQGSNSPLETDDTEKKNLKNNRVEISPI